VIGKKGEDIERLRQEVAKLMKMGFNDVRLNIAEIRKPELDAQLVAEGIAQQVERRVMFRRAMKRAVMNTMPKGGSPCTRCGPTSTTASAKPTRRSARSASRCG